MLRFLGRLIWVPLSFIIAAMLAAFVLFTLGAERLTQEIGAATGGDGTLDQIFGYFDQAWLIANLASALSIVPGVLLVIVGEVARIRSALYYVLGGGAALAVIPFMTSAAAEGLTGVSLPPTAMLQVFATAGFSAGLVYWLICGRTA